METLAEEIQEWREEGLLVLAGWIDEWMEEPRTDGQLHRRPWSMRDGRRGAGMGREWVTSGCSQ